ncbi:transcriptional regulator [Enterococcus hirae]|uniref:LCP family glycopolymer transferase n=1 Tax=Enterococcus hirae TaxID=1354 RepID=UPI0013775315|nr:LCP family protein [Enterococcus hirae]NBA19394.1 transcriptional regulator [Enterococcus hirae]NBA21764.1 transcriptional regulator [Enterococcus hirae]NBA34965.1 transcriptional regulator [Enterococcus hirae]NBA40620.1 transcriptional regulator [Enterococcus hirae]NBA42936.1 transcriptional regulator [Enterococcus hirae]
MKKKLSIILILLISLVCCITIYLGKIYFDIKHTIQESYQKVGQTTKFYKNDIVSKKPFSVLLLGIDSGDFGRADKGRSDTIVVMTVNPQKKTTTLMSIPRDTYTEIIGKGENDKLNHAYAYGGASMTIASVQNLLDIPINYYAEINLKGLQELVDIVGGVDVNNTFTFDYKGTRFPIGRQHLDGKKALEYSRMRYDDPKGDYGRQKRQQQVIIGILDKLKSIKTLTNYKNILSVMGKNVKTDFSWDTIQEIFKYYKTAFNKVDSDQLVGVGFTGDGITGENGISYQKIEKSELVRAKNKLKAQLNIKIVN